jgi:hypothetical protein
LQKYGIWIVPYFWQKYQIDIEGFYFSFDIRMLGVEGISLKGTGKFHSMRGREYTRYSQGLWVPGVKQGIAFGK